MTDRSQLKNFESLETGRLILRRLQKKDAIDMYEYAKEKEVTRYLLWRPHPDIRYTENFLSAVQRYYKNGNYFDYAVVLKSEGKMIGTCGFAHVFEENNCAEAGYVINPAYQNMGYASEALFALIRFGFCNLGFNRIEARYIVGNDKSRRVMEKCGMTFEGVHRAQMLIKGRYSDIGVCALLHDEFTAKYGSRPVEIRQRNRFFC